MIHKKIDISQAIFSNIEDGAATSYIDYRISSKKPLTQRSFDQAVNAANKCEMMGICSATEALDITVEKGWQGVTVEYLANELSRRQSAASEAMQVTVSHTRTTSLEHDLTDKSWLN